MCSAGLALLQSASSFRRETLFFFLMAGLGRRIIEPGGGDLVLLSAISWTRDRPFMIAAVSTWGPSELTLERPVKSCLRLIPDVVGDFCDTSRCPFKRSRGQLKPPARQVRHRWFRKISGEPLHQS